MGAPSVFDTVERDLLARFPTADAAPHIAAVYQGLFGSSVIEAADTVAVAIGVVHPGNLEAYTTLLASVITGAIGQAALDVGVLDQPWIPEAQRWAVRAFFARLAEVRSAMAGGGRA